MTDAELMDKLLAGPTEEEESDLKTWEAAHFMMNARMAELFWWFGQVPKSKETADQLYELDMAFSNDERPTARGKFVGILAAYEKYTECGQDCQNIHERLYWTGRTRRIPIEYLSTLYNRWLSEQHAKSR